MSDEDHVIITRKILVSKEDMDALNKLRERRREEGRYEWRIRDEFMHGVDVWGRDIEDEEGADGIIITRRYRVSKKDMDYGMGVLDKIKEKGTPEDRIRWYFRGFLATYGEEIIDETL